MNSTCQRTRKFKQWKRNIFRKKTLYRKLPILTWLPQYNLTKLIADTIAGITVGLTIIPQSLGVAGVAELPHVYGLYSSYVGCFVYICLGSTKAIAIGPTMTTAIITLSYTKGLPPEYSVLLCFVTGVVTLIMSFLQLGFITNFISKPVLSGLTSASAISIASVQLKNLLGLRFSAEGFLPQVEGIIENISDTKGEDCIISVITIITLLVLMKIELIFKRFGEFGPMFNKCLKLLSAARSVLVVTVATIIYGIRGEPATIGLVGFVPEGLADFQSPSFSYSKYNNATGEMDEFSLGFLFRNHFSALIVIPLSCLMEHISVSKALAPNGHVDTNQEMLCIGVTNIIGSFFSAMPVTGAFGRTAINNAAGAQSPLGGLLTGIIVLFALSTFTPQFYFIPKASLSSVVVCAVIFMVDFDIIFAMWRTKKMDLIPWLLTFIVSMLVGLEYGVMAGMGFNVLFLLYYAARPGLRVNTCTTTNEMEFLFLELDRSLTYPSVEYIQYIVSKSVSNWSSVLLPVVLDCQHVQFADYTAAQGMTELFKQFKGQNQELILWQVKPSIVNILKRFTKSDDVAFQYCYNETELEIILKEREKKVHENDKDSVIEINNN